MRRQIRTSLLAFLALLVSAVTSIPVTLLLLPLWQWLEASFGIESIGHSGPAGWCYLAVFAVLAAGSLTVLLKAEGRQ